MKLRVTLLIAIVFTLVRPAVWSQGQGATPTPQERAAALKQSLAANRAQLQKYQWVETTTVSLKGEVKKQEQQQARYGADGKVQKTPVAGSPAATAPPPPQAQRGLKGRIVANKVADVKDDMEDLKTLVGLYVPPNPQQLQQGAAKADIQKPDAAGSASITFNDYAKPGDKVSFTFDVASKKLRTYAVNTYQDSPKDVVTVTTNFASLMDGTNYAQQTVLESKGKQIKITIVNSGHKPL